MKYFTKERDRIQNIDFSRRPSCPWFATPIKYVGTVNSLSAIHLQQSGTLCVNNNVFREYMTDCHSQASLQTL